MKNTEQNNYERYEVQEIDDAVYQVYDNEDKKYRGNSSSNRNEKIRECTILNEEYEKLKKDLGLI